MRSRLEKACRINVVLERDEYEAFIKKVQKEDEFIAFSQIVRYWIKSADIPTIVRKVSRRR